MPDRRGLFKELLREAAGVAQELSAAIKPAKVEEEDPESWRPPVPVPAPPATSSVDEAALRVLVGETGLEDRVVDVRESARMSLRLTHSSTDREPGRARLGGSPDLPPGFAWPTWEGRELGFLGQIELSELGVESPLPREGLLLFFYDLAALPSGLSPTHRGSCRVVLIPAPAAGLELDDQHVPSLRAVPLEVSGELTLPGAWSLNVEPLELTMDEIEAWDDLRDRLAAAHGVELEETSAAELVLHRLLGYAQEIGREVELDCQIAAAGLDADDMDVYYEARADHEAAARDWRLLLQLSGDESFEPLTAGSFERLYICVPEDDLERGAFDRAWAILR